MLRSLCLAAALSFSATDAQAQTAPTRKAPAKPKRPRPAPSTGDSQAPSTSTKTGEQGTAAAPSKADSAAAGAGTTSAPAAATAGASTAQAPRGFDQEEFRRQVMEEVRRELQKTKDEVKQETAWVEQDSQARVQDSEAVESLKQRVNPFTPLSVLAARRGSGTVNVKRVWGRVNTQLGELLFGRMGYHWGLGILHNDGNCLDCDYGDTYDRIAFAPREFKGHHLSVMFDILDKGASTTGDTTLGGQQTGELGRSVDLDTLDDGYRLALEITRVDTAE